MQEHSVLSSKKYIWSGCISRVKIVVEQTMMLEVGITGFHIGTNVASRDIIPICRLSKTSVKEVFNRQGGQSFHGSQKIQKVEAEHLVSTQQETSEDSPKEDLEKIVHKLGKCLKR